MTGYCPGNGSSEIDIFLELVIHLSVNFVDKFGKETEISLY